jgi:hypothetical protein
VRSKRFATTYALIEGILPPTLNYQAPDPECNLDYVPNIARQLEGDARPRIALSNSSGIGGNNACLVLGVGINMARTSKRSFHGMGGITARGDLTCKSRQLDTTHNVHLADLIKLGSFLAENYLDRCSASALAAVAALALRDAGFIHGRSTDDTSTHDQLCGITLGHESGLHRNYESVLGQGD